MRVGGFIPLLAFGGGLVSAGALAQSPTWADDRGEPVTQEDLASLGQDVASVVGPPQGVEVAGSELEQRTTELSSQLRCPVCQGLSVQDSTSEAARNMKAQVRALVAAGYTDDQTFAYFEHSYGEFIRLMPRAEGFNLVVWLLPAAGLLLGLAIVGRVVKRLLRHEVKGDEQIAASIDPALLPWVERVREELAGNDV